MSELKVKFFSSKILGQQMPNVGKDILMRTSGKTPWKILA